MCPDFAFTKLYMLQSKSVKTHLTKVLTLKVKLRFQIQNKDKSVVSLNVQNFIVISRKEFRNPNAKRNNDKNICL